MPSATDRIDFGPPRDAGSIRAFGLALIAHALLIAALTWGVNWNRSDKAVAFEAEMWSNVPEQAAPKLVEAPPPPPEAPAPKPPEIKPAPALPDPDIALEQEKKRKLQALKEAEAQKLEKLEKQKAEALAKKEKDLKLKEEQAKRKAEELKKAEAKKPDPKDNEKQKIAEADAKKLREDNLKRMMGQAGATGGANATGTAQASKGPSASYGGKVRAKVKPNVVFTDDIAGNPTAEVEVRTTPDGTIVSQRIVKSSGNAAWDDAVLKALVRTGSMPRDVDGRVPSPMILEFRPKD